MTDTERLQRLQKIIDFDAAPKCKTCGGKSYVVRSCDCVDDNHSGGHHRTCPDCPEYPGYDARLNDLRVICTVGHIRPHPEHCPACHGKDWLSIRAEDSHLAGMKVMQATEAEIRPMYEPGYAPWSAAVPRAPGEGEWRLADTPWQALYEAVAKSEGFEG